MSVSNKKRWQIFSGRATASQRSSLSWRLTRPWCHPQRRPSPPPLSTRSSGRLRRFPNPRNQSILRNRKIRMIPRLPTPRRIPRPRWRSRKNLRGGGVGVLHDPPGLTVEEIGAGPEMTSATAGTTVHALHGLGIPSAAVPVGGAGRGCGTGGTGAARGQGTIGETIAVTVGGTILVTAGERCAEIVAVLAPERTGETEAAPARGVPGRTIGGTAAALDTVTTAIAVAHLAQEPIDGIVLGPGCGTAAETGVALAPGTETTGTDGAAAAAAAVAAHALATTIETEAVTGREKRKTIRIAAAGAARGRHPARPALLRA